MKEAKKTQITEQICKQIRLMRKGGANQTEIGNLLGINPSTVSRIERAGFDLETYLENKRIAREKEKAAKEKVRVELVYDPTIAEEYRREQEAKQAEEQVPGQIQMELPEKETEEQNKQYRFLAAMVDKMCREQAAMVDDLCLKIDKLNDTLNIIYRAIRKE